jgi:hypothetical protein
MMRGVIFLIDQKRFMLLVKLKQFCRLFFLFALFLMGSAWFVYIYHYNLENDILHVLVLFIISILVNALSLGLYNSKNKIISFVLFAIIPFILFIFFYLKFKNDYFSQCRYLVFIPIVYSFFQMKYFLKLGSIKKV